MSELHMVLVREISGKPTEADLELDSTQLDNMTRSEQAMALLEAYDHCKSALEDKKVEDAQEYIKKLIPFPRRDDIPVQ